MLGIPTTSALIERLAVDKSLRRILGWERRSQVPSEATFSRAFAEFAQGDLPDKMHVALIERSLGGRIVGVIARDATEIEAREKPAAKEANDKKDDPPSDGAQPPRKRGRPHKDEQRPKPEPTRLERQTSQNVDQMLAELPTACDVGSNNRRSSQARRLLFHLLAQQAVAISPAPYKSIIGGNPPRLAVERV